MIERRLTPKMYFICILSDGRTLFKALGRRGASARLMRETMSIEAEPAESKRALIIDEIVARTGIDEAMIERLVRNFYRRVVDDPLLSPIFNERVHDWEAHIARMCAFWSSVALMSGRYHGQPMVAHLPLPVDTPHFERWLAIFAATVHDVCPAAAAAHFLERAQRIADSLELGIAARNGEIRPRRPRPEHGVGRDRPERGG